MSEDFYVGGLISVLPLSIPIFIKPVLHLCKKEVQWIKLIFKNIASSNRSIQKGGDQTIAEESAVSQIKLTQWRRVRLIPDEIMLDVNEISKNLIKIAQESPTQKKSCEDEIDNVSPLEIFGMKIGILRRRKGISITELVEATQISAINLTKIEIGKVSLEQIIINLPRLAHALGVSESDLSKELIDSIDNELVNANFESDVEQAIM